MASRRDQTTQFIRDAACRELIEHGHAALTMDGIARRSFVSVGSVYARYQNKSAVLHDLALHLVAPALSGAGDAVTQIAEGEIGLAVLLRSITGDQRVDDAVHALVELALASRHDPSLADQVGDLTQTLASLLQVDHPDVVLREGLRWFLVAAVFGKCVLNGAGCSIPPLWPSLARFVEGLLASEGNVDRGGRPTPDVARTRVEVPVPSSPRPRVEDELADSLAGATREELARAGLIGANISAIARRSGVTTGAVYRRYRSKGELVNDAVVRELDASRYGWTVDFVSSLVDPESARTAGDVLADRLSAMLDDEAWVLTTLEMLAAAHIDSDVRETLSSQVHSAASSRSRMFEDLRDIGVVQADIDPHLLGWLIQLVPAGGRVLSAIGMPIGEDELRRSINAVVDAIV